MIFLILLVDTSLQVNATDTQVLQVYEDFQTSIEKKYSPEKQKNIMKSLQKRLLDYNYEKHSSKKSDLIEDMIELNHDALFQDWKKTELSHTEQESWEAKTREQLQTQTSQIELNQQYMILLRSWERDFLQTNSNGEYVEGNDIYRVKYDTFFPVLFTTLEGLKSKKGVIIEVNPWEYRFLENYSLEKKIPYSQMQDVLAGFFTDEYRIIEKAWFFYGYLFQNYKFYQDSYGAYQSQLDASGFKKQSTFLYRNKDGKYHFVTDYTERKLIGIWDIFGVSHKELFLKYMLSDAKHLSSNISENMRAIKNQSQTLPRWNNKEETIEGIYAWVLKNISYTQIIDLNNTQMFSAGEAFQTKNGVCTAYSKLMVYLMLYQNLFDLEMIEGYVIDASDFPEIGHAWVRVGERYYDPTFDDPIGTTLVRTPEQYRYFNLPKDIFYANRFHYDELPKTFETANNEQIRQYIFNVLSNLVNKYGPQAYEYLVFAPVKFRNTYNISANTLITPEILAQKIGVSQVENNSFRFQKNEKTLTITGIRYYILTSDSTQGTLDSLNYQVDDMTLFDWELPDGSREWRLAYELTTR
jgi:hypothetical protein